MRRFTSYFGPSATARRSSVVLTPCPPLPAGEGGFTTARSFVITVGEAEPHAGQKAAPRGISARHEGQVGWVVTARKIRGQRAGGNGSLRVGAQHAAPLHYLDRCSSSGSFLASGSRTRCWCCSPGCSKIGSPFRRRARACPTPNE